MNDSGLHAVVEAFYIYAKDAVEVFFSGAFDGADVRDSGIVDENRKAVAWKKLIEERVDLVTVGDIAQVRGGVSAGSGDLLAGSLGVVEIDVEDAERGSVGGELARDGAADAAASAGDDGDATVEAEGAWIGG
jgi:hypothetical protein